MGHFNRSLDDVEYAISFIILNFQLKSNQRKFVLILEDQKEVTNLDTEQLEVRCSFLVKQDINSTAQR